MLRTAIKYGIISVVLLQGIHSHATEVEGRVVGVWNLAGSPYYVRGEIFIPANQTLTIEPGVEVVFLGHHKFIVNTDATLSANGTVEDSILFTASDTSEGWWGIRFDSASQNCSLSYCVLSWGKAEGYDQDGWGGAIFCNETDLTLSNCRITNCKSWGSFPYALGGGIYCIASTLNINNCLIQHCETYTNNFNTHSFGAGIYCEESNLTISSSEINNCIAEVYGSNSGADGAGIYCKYSNLNIMSCNISYNIGHSYYYLPSSMGACIYLYESNLYTEECTCYGNHSEYVFNCSYSHAVYKNNIISDNYAQGIRDGSYDPATPSEIYNNIIMNNYNGLNLVSLDMSIVKCNILMGNSSGYLQGGGIRISGNESQVSDNIVVNNYSVSGGGGIYSYGSISAPNSPTITDNIISGNSSVKGGGLCISYSTPIIMNNVIYGNHAYDFGGGIYIGESSFVISRNVFCDNSSDDQGGAVYSAGDTCQPEFVNCIMSGNSQPQIYEAYGSSVNVSYCNVSGNWPGIGNIDEDPFFVNPDLYDYRLQWGSPCIDAGDPNPQYNDPDSTRADMGAFFYDQSMPVRLLVTPYEIPFLVATEGGDIAYDLVGTNIDSFGQVAVIWCDLMLPDSTVSGPVFGPEVLMIEAGETATLQGICTLIGSDPMGVYHLDSYAVVNSDTTKDSFMFGKTGTTGSGVVSVPSKPIADSPPTTYILLQNYPNPFNPVTTISFALPKASKVLLSVYDVSGRQVETLVDGWQDAGQHEVTFDGTHLASGIYVYQLTAGNYTASGKMVLLK